MIGPAVSFSHGSDTVDVHLIPIPRDDEVDHMPVSGMGCIQVVLRSSFCLLLSVRTQRYNLKISENQMNW